MTEENPLPTPEDHRATGDPAPQPAKPSMSEEVVSRSVLLPASQERVWRSLTDPEDVREWFGSEVEWSLEPGAPARFPDAQREGRVESVVAPTELTFSWWPRGRQDQASRVTYHLERESEEATELQVTETRLDLLPTTQSWGPEDQAAFEAFSAHACARPLVTSTADSAAAPSGLRLLRVGYATEAVGVGAWA